MTDIINQRMTELKDEEYKAFHSKLMPGVETDSIIGVRIPLLRRMTSQLQKDFPEECMDYLDELPHQYYEGNNVHMFLLNSMDDYQLYVDKIWQFLPYVNNWATCDIGANKKLVKNNAEAFLAEIVKMLASSHPYTIRFGINSLMTFYLDQLFKPEYLEMVAAVRSEEYYVNMMIAWYFATALAKQWDFAVAYIEQGKLPEWVHRKTIQKAVESYRITDSEKQYLKGLKNIASQH